MIEISSADVLEITGLTPKQLQVWCEQGVVTPRSGEGKGNHRRFSVVQTVALSHTRAWSIAGASLSLIREIVAYLTSFSEKRLVAEFKAGRKILIAVPGGKTALRKSRADDPFDYRLLNIESLYQHVIAKIAEIKDKQSRNATGRSRGLAASK